MKKIIRPVLALSLCLLSPIMAEERAPHHDGKPAPTLTVALDNLKKANAELAEILQKKKLSGGDLNQVHILSYTIENALERIGIEQKRLAELMEEVHVASEQSEPEKVKSSGAAFLKAAAPLLR